MGFYETVSAIVSIISFFALIGNVLQYTKKREQEKDLFQMVQTQYNNYYLIARALTRVNNSDKDGKEKEFLYETNLNFIRGVSDSARIDLINFAKNQLNKNVYYQHPAYPERCTFSDAVKMGLPPEKEDITERIETAKKILKGKDYQVQVGKSPDRKQKAVESYIILNEEKGGVPGSNIGMAVYCNTTYNNPEIHDDQVFFIVEEGNGKVKIGEREIDIHPHNMFVVPPQIEHSILTNDGNIPVKVIWFHNSTF